MNNLERDHLYKFDMLDDPIFKTNARNFNFKYVPSAQFEKVIKNVHKDRLNKQKKILWNEYSQQPAILTKLLPNDKVHQQTNRKRRVFKTKSSTVKVLTDRKKDPDKNVQNEQKIPIEDEIDINISNSNNNEPKIRVMSDEEIHDVIESAVKEILNNKHKNNNNKKEFKKSPKKHKNIEKNLYQYDENQFMKLEENLDKEQLLVKCDQLEDNYKKKDQLEHKPTSFCLLKDKLKEYDNIPSEYDKILLKSPKKYDKVHDSKKNEQTLDLNYKTSQMNILQLNSDRTDRFSARSQNIVYDKDIYIDTSSDSSESVSEFKSLKNLLNISSSKDINCNFIESDIDDNDDNIMVDDSNVGSQISINGEIRRTRTLIENNIRTKSPPKSCRSPNICNSPLQELEIMTSNNILDHILKTKKKEETKQKSKFYMDLEAIMNLKVPIRHEDEISSHSSNDLETENSIHDDNEVTESNYIIPEIPIDEQIEFLNTEELISAPPVDNVSSRSKKTSTRSPTARSIRTNRSVNFIEPSINHTETSLNHIEMPINQTEIPVNHNETSLKHSAGSLHNNNDMSQIVSDQLNETTNNNRTACIVLTGYTESSSIPPIDIPIIKKKKKMKNSKNLPIHENELKKKETKESKLSLTSPTKRHNVKTTTPKLLTSRPIDGDAAYKEVLIEIFSKVTGYQEKIIYLLKKLQSDLLDTSTWDAIEKKRREKNIMEFSTRFSRNYVYQIERMIEEIRVFTVEDFRKKKYSESLYVKVCGLYGSLYQALNSYINQLKYFIFNQYPKKLDILICMISTATKICIQKKFFDKDDALVKVIFQHCESLLNYINELEENRKITTKEIIPKSQQKPQISKWDQIAGSQAKLSMYDTVRSANSGIEVKKKNSKSKKSKMKSRASPSATIQSVKSEEIPKEKELLPKQNQNNDIYQYQDQTKEDEENKEKEHIPKRLNTFLRTRVHKIKKRNDTPRNDSARSIITTQVEKIMMETETTSSTQQSPRKNDNKTSPGKYNNRKSDDNIEKFEQFEDNLGGVISNKDLLRSILLDLQAITKKEVKQVLSPLLNHIGSLKNDSTQNAATILNKLNSQLINLTDNTSESMYFNQREKTFINDELEKQNLDKENNTNSSNNIITVVEYLTGNMNNNGQQNTNITDDQQDTIILTNNKQQIEVEAFENFSQRKLLDNQQQQQQNVENLQYKKISNCSLGLGENNDVICLNTNNNNINQMEQFEIEVGYGSSRITTDIMNCKNQYCAPPSSPSYTLNGCGDEIVHTTNKNLQLRRDDDIQQVLYERNIQYTFIRSTDINEEDKMNTLSNHEELISDHHEVINLTQNYNQKDEFSSIPNTPNNRTDINCTDKKLATNLDRIFETRLEFIKKISENPLYVNENFQDPWKIIGRISDRLITEITTAAEKDINFGEENFITDFLNMELNC